MAPRCLGIIRTRLGKEWGRALLG
ncbi:uncharacterized protein G2W53_007138 [Senna tora]|uniref:Uncharacterized protein n=1 Tax=Senna tora TaxID=362788 RepID=A0A834X5K9_9FABA|nr:uncharacterized protein G2W53_007138 [Senna tora]